VVDYVKTRASANQQAYRPLGMKPHPRIVEEVAGTRFGSLLVLGLLAPVAGAAAGLLGALFRLSLNAADRLREASIAAAQHHALLGFLFVTGGCAAAVACAAWLVRRLCPDASGSGIPHVEGVLNGDVPPAPPSLIPFKFTGGALAIGAGLALGREGPTVQMGATVADLLGVVCRRPWPDCRVLLAAGAGAGLATAFNAPIAGAVFVLEELVRRFEAHIAIAALGASAAAIAVARALLGAAPDFAVAPLAYAGVQTWPLFVALGAIAGLLAALYNAALLGALAVADRFGGWPAELRAAAIGAAVGVLAWFLPDLVGGGDAITQRTLIGGFTLAVLPLAFLLRFALGAVSYAAATPGGLFAPLLVLGAQLGFFYGALCRLLFPEMGLDPTAFAVVGMAAFFTGMVQAPVTGIVLVVEMTASFTMLQPMIAACFAAMLVPNLLGAPPIYDALRERTAKITRKAGARAENSR
jgi:CIC family chloride channel protein